jgi:hypothetical protein
MSPTIYLGDSQVEASLLADVCRRFGVIELSLFGSAVRGELDLVTKGGLNLCGMRLRSCETSSELSSR